MEANFFKYFARDIAPGLVGRRVEKVFSPLSGVWTLKLGSKAHLICVTGRRRHALFLSSMKPSNPPKPPAEVGWWRKRIQGCKIRSCWVDWPTRRLALGLTRDTESWLILDLRSGLSLAEELDSGFGMDPLWPTYDQILVQEDIFRRFPHITPPLRHTLNSLDEQSGRELLGSLQANAVPRVFSWARSWAGHSPDWLVPWPIPAPLCERFSQITEYACAQKAAEDYGWSAVDGFTDARSGKQAVQKREYRKLHKQLVRIAEDEKRLQEMRAQKEAAELLKGNLYRLDPESRAEYVDIEDGHGNPCRLELDPRRSIRENMEYWFGQAKKGTRGLQHVHRRRQEVEASLAALSRNGDLNRTEDSDSFAASEVGSKQIGKKKDQYLLQGIRRYTSSDGFVVLRGKNSRANHYLLTRIASPHDLWFHAADGPGAHVVLRRSGQTAEVPERSLREAAGIAGLRSHFSTSAKAEIICAQVKHVRPIKGGPPGQVRVGQIQKTLHVPLHPDLEARLHAE